MGKTEIKEVKTADELKRMIDMYATNGYEIQQQTNDSAIVTKRVYGKLIYHIILIPLSFLVGNVIYAAYCYLNSPKIIIRVTGE